MTEGNRRQATPEQEGVPAPQPATLPRAAPVATDRVVHVARRYAGEAGTSPPPVWASLVSSARAGFRAWQHHLPSREDKRPREGAEAYRGRAHDDRLSTRFGLDQFELRDAVVPTVLVHIGLLLFAPLAVALFGSDQARAMGPLEIWNHWDAGHFLEVAARGYDPSGDPARSVIFPLYPLLIRIGSFVIDPLFAAMAISFGATVAAAVGLYRLVRPVSRRVIARNAVLALNIFPTAYALVAPYSEAPFLAFALWAFVAARSDKWGWAGLLGMFAALTRLEGAFLLPALGLEYLVLRRGRYGSDCLCIGLIALGPLALLAINALAYGDPLFFLGIQRSVFVHYSVAPWDMLIPLARTALAGGSGESYVMVYLAPFVGFVVLAVVALWSLRSRHSRGSYAIVTWLNLASLSMLNWPISVPRYLLGVFPLFVAGGSLGRRPGVGGALATLSVLLLAAFTTLFVIGHWAF